jgi:glycosyltransferase involved in cell wall biosynthesis
LKEISALESAGYSVRALGISGKDETSPLRNDRSMIRLKSRGLRRIPKSARHGLSAFELLLKMFPRAFKTNADVVHCHDVMVLPVGVLLKFLFSMPLIYDAHELESDRNGLSNGLKRLTWVAEKLCWRHIDVLITVSPSIDEWYLSEFGSVRSAVILNSPSISISPHHSNNYLRERFAISSKAPIYVYVGILGLGRGIDSIIEVFTRTSTTAHVVFLGEGEWTSKISALSQTYSNLHLHPPVHHRQVVEVIESADFGLCLVEKVSLSDYLCLPNKLFEYCFAGLPVVASDFPDMRQVVGEHRLGVVCNPNANDLVRAMHLLENLNESEMFQNLAPLGWESQATKLMNIYAQLLKKQ